MDNHVPSLLPEGKNWKLVWNDEFNGDTLDLSKWDFRLHLLQTRHKTYTDKAARLDGKGNLELFLMEENGEYYSTQLQTGYNYLDRPGKNFCFHATSTMKWPVSAIQTPKFMHKYGYYEIRCRLQKQPGWWSAFWLQSPCNGATLNPAESGVEVDIMENFDRKGTVMHTNHYNGYGEDHQSVGSKNFQVDKDAWHIFACEWRPDAYIYYVDGKETWRCNGPISHREQFILISTECGGYRENNQPCEDLKKAVLPDSFLVDFVRVYDEVDANGARLFE